MMLIKRCHHPPWHNTRRVFDGLEYFHKNVVRNNCSRMELRATSCVANGRDYASSRLLFYLTEDEFDVVKNNFAGVENFGFSIFQEQVTNWFQKVVEHEEAAGLKRGGEQMADPFSTRKSRLII